MSLKYEKKKTKYAWSQFYTKCDEVNGLWGMIDTLHLTPKQTLRMYLQLNELGYASAPLFVNSCIKKYRLMVAFRAWEAGWPLCQSAGLMSLD